MRGSKARVRAPLALEFHMGLVASQPRSLQAVPRVDWPDTSANPPEKRSLPLWLIRAPCWRHEVTRTQTEWSKEDS